MNNTQKYVDAVYDFIHNANGGTGVPHCIEKQWIAICITYPTKLQRHVATVKAYKEIRAIAAELEVYIPLVK